MKTIPAMYCEHANEVPPEIMTHRMLTKSSASSRAIPVDKLIQRVREDPWIPDYIGANQKGMQAGAELTEQTREWAVRNWLVARDNAVDSAIRLSETGVHKQIVNRLLEPWMWITVIISGTEWDNFFGLRTHEAAEPHFQHIARMMRDARDASVPDNMEAGEWHLPLVDRTPGGVDWNEARSLLFADRTFAVGSVETKGALVKIHEVLRKVSVGRCARVSYLNHEGKRDLKADIELHDRLMVQRPLHAAPAEHVAQAMDWQESERRLFKTGSASNPQALRSEFVRVRDLLATRGDATGETWGAMDEWLDTAGRVLHKMQSGNYLGFRQYRKTLADEHIGGLMP